MPITTFITLILTVIASAGVTVLAIDKWGAFNVLPILMIAALAVRWAMRDVTPDDGHS